MQNIYLHAGNKLVIKNHDDITWANTDYFHKIIWEYPSTSRIDSGFSRDLSISREKTEEMRTTVKHIFFFKCFFFSTLSLDENTLPLDEKCMLLYKNGEMYSFP